MSGAIDFEDRVCVVTGAASGIGRGVALGFAQAGGRVAVLDRDLAGARATLALIAEQGGTAIAVEVDTGDAASIRTAHDRVMAGLGAADVLVNNAGVVAGGDLATLPLAEWERVMAVNCTGYFLCAQIFCQHMLAQGRGAVVHVTSLSAEMPAPHVGAYSVSKAGASMLSRLLALEWGPKGVRSNAVHPGFVKTALSAATYEDPDKAAARAAAVPLGRVGTPEDIAAAVLFLASDMAGYINGAEIVADGAFRSNLMANVARKN